MAQGAPNATSGSLGRLFMGFILASLFFNTLTAPVVKMTQNSEGGYDYNKWCIYFFAELMKLGVTCLSPWCFKAYQENGRARGSQTFQCRPERFCPPRAGLCILRSK